MIHTTSLQRRTNYAPCTYVHNTTTCLNLNHHLQKHRNCKLIEIKVLGGGGTQSDVKLGFEGPYPRFPETGQSFSTDI